MAIQDGVAAPVAMIPCKEADDALKYAIMGVFCVCIGLVLEPLAIAKAFQAKKMIAANPQLTGSGKATAAIVTGFVVCFLYLLELIARAATAGHH